VLVLLPLIAGIAAGVAAGGHLPPAALLHVRRLREGGAKPIAHRRREEVESGPHDQQS